MAKPPFYNIRYSPEFAEQLDEAPDYIQLEFHGQTGFEGMALELQRAPEYGDLHTVIPSRRYEGRYYMLFPWALAAISYTINHDEKMVTIQALINPRLAL